MFRLLIHYTMVKVDELFGEKKEQKKTLLRFKDK